MKFEQFILESIEDKGILKACFMAGTPGAGKSFVISKISGGVEPRVVNTDTWTEFLGAINAKTWPQFEEKIKHLTKKQLALYLNSMLPLWIDGTSGSPPAVLRRKGILSSIGYDTSMIWIETPLEDAIERASKRKREVPIEFIKDTYEKIRRLKNYYKSEFRTFVEVKNGEGELTEKVVNDLYKKMNSWFMSPIENPIGTALYKKMKKQGDKYLTDTEYTMEYINRLVNTWYRS